MRTGETNEALKHYQQAIQENPAHAESHYQMAVLLAAGKQKQAAIEHLHEAVRLKPDWALALNNLAWAIATDDNCKLPEATEAVRFAERAVKLTGGKDASSLDTLSVAWARSEVFVKATDAAKMAIEIAANEHQTNLVSEIQKRIDLYNNRRPYSE
jgi:tetratricopeptide (TPR) repeat protein